MICLFNKHALWNYLFDGVNAGAKIGSENDFHDYHPHDEQSGEDVCECQEEGQDLH